MSDFLSALSQWLTPLWEMSVTAAYAAAVVIVLRLLLKKRAPKQVLCLLWLVVFARLLVPVSLESPLSIVPDAQQVQFAQDLPSKLPGGGQTTSTQGQTPAQNHELTQGQPSAQGPGVVTPVISNPAVPALTAPEGMTPTAPTHKEQTVFPWRAVLAGVWLAGVASLTLYALVFYFRLRRCLFDAIRAKDGAWEHPAVNSPFILGFVRPRIYLPAGLAGQPRQFILCHERAHLRRLDHIVKPVCWAALVLHWFNPMVWCAYLLMGRDIEAACDEAVIRRLGPHVKADYSATLLSLATNGRVPAPCPLAFDEGDAKGRIKNVLRYRRPALWIVVVSVIAAVMAAVCLLTDPVAAKEPEGDPNADPSPDASASQEPVNLADTLLDPWMKEILDGERSFSAGGDTEFNIHQLRTMVYGDEELPRLTLEVGRLTVIDLDRDGINELVIWPTGEHDDPTEIGYYTGYFIFRRAGDTARVYWPGWRSIGDLKADGTFDWSGSAFEWGTGSASFDVDGMFTINKITWCDNNINAEHYFVDGLKATQAEFEAAAISHRYKNEPVWYTYADGVLARVLPSIPLDYYALPDPLPIPDFLDEEQQLLYRQAYVLYDRLFGRTNEAADFFPGQGVLEPANAVRRGSLTYTPASGLFARWDDFERAVLSVFTRDSWDAKNSFDVYGNTIYINEDGRLYYLNYGRGGGNYNGFFPETFRLVEQTDNTIFFIMTGYYSDDYPREGESYEDVNARNVAYWEYSIDFPMRMVKTENGWRFDEFHLAITDDDSEFYSQRVLNPDAPTSLPAPEPTPDNTPDPSDTMDEVKIVRLGSGYQLNWNGKAYPVATAITTANCPTPWCEDWDYDGHPEALFPTENLFTVYDMVNGSLVSHTFGFNTPCADVNSHTITSFEPDNGNLTVTYSWGALDESTRRDISAQVTLPDSFFEGCEELRDGRTLNVQALPGRIHSVPLGGGRLWHQVDISLTDGTTVSPVIGTLDFIVCYTEYGFVVDTPREIELDSSLTA